MKYRVEFESAEIKRCWDCPMCRGRDYDDHDYCRAMRLLVKKDKGIPDICPLEVLAENEVKVKRERKRKFTNELHQLRKLSRSDDTEVAHVEADDILCGVLIELGYENLVEAYEKIRKWYA